MSWISLADWIGIVRWALTTNHVSGPLNLTAPAPVTNAEFARVLGRVLGRPSFVPTPAFALRLALGELADALILGGQRVVPTRARRWGTSSSTRRSKPLCGRFMESPGLRTRRYGALAWSQDQDQGPRTQTIAGAPARKSPPRTAVEFAPSQLSSTRA